MGYETPKVAGATKTGVQNATYSYADDAEASDAYAITLSPAVTAYATGQRFVFKANTANTGASSLNVNGLGAIALKKNHDQDTATGDIEAGSILSVVYDGTNFQIISIGAVVAGDMNASTYDPASIAEQVVGLIATQSLTNKTIDSDTNTVHADLNYLKVRNVSGGTLTAGTPVYITGYNSGQDRPTVDKADANVSGSMPAIGLVEVDIANNANGKVVALGEFDSMNTSAYSVGDILYVSTTAGTLTSTKPTGSGELVQAIARVIRSHASTGRLHVHGAGRANDVPNDPTFNENVTFNKTAVFDAEYDNGNSGTSKTIDLGLGNKQKLTLTGNVTLTLTAPAGASSLILKLVQDATGSRTVTFPSTVKWAGGTAPTLTTTASAIDIISLYWDGTSYHGSSVLDLS